MKYEDYVRRICGENWRNAPKDEKEGGIAVACLMGFMRGVRPTINDMSIHLQVSPDEIAIPFGRLHKNGIFFSTFNAKRDQALQFRASDIDNDRAWCFIAGIGSGFIGI